MSYEKCLVQQKTLCYNTIDKRNNKSNGKERPRAAILGRFVIQIYERKHLRSFWIVI